MLSKVRRVGRVGKGSSGTVWEATFQDGKHRIPLALKEIPLPDDEEKRRMVVHEMRMMRETDHPCIVACHGVYFTNSSFQMVMELVDGGSLLDLMKAGHCRIPHEAIAAVSHSVFSALAYLHDECAVVHRDVKPGNILLSLEGNVKLADLGICTQPGESPSQMWVGTVTYMSPERMVGDKYSYSADVWSAGLVVMEAAMGVYPFMSPALKAGQLEFWDLLDMIVNGSAPDCLLEEAKVGACEGMLELIARSMHKDELQRASAKECLELSFLSGKGKPGREVMRKQILASWVRGVHEAQAAIGRASRADTSRSCSVVESHSALQDFVSSLGGDRFRGLLNML